MLRTGLIYTREHDLMGYGLSCMDCHMDIEYDDEYAERLTGMIEDAECVELICSKCAKVTWFDEGFSS